MINAQLLSLDFFPSPSNIRTHCSRDSRFETRLFNSLPPPLRYFRGRVSPRICVISLEIFRQIRTRYRMCVCVYTIYFRVYMCSFAFTTHRFDKDISGPDLIYSGQYRERTTHRFSVIFQPKYHLSLSLSFRLRGNSVTYVRRERL